MSKIKLGAVVRDRITGFTGVAHMRTEFLYMGPQFGVQPRELDKEGAVATPHYYDEPQLEFVEDTDLAVIPPQLPDDPICLGDEVREVITGFSGVATAVTTFMNGCRKVDIAPKTLKPDGQPCRAMSLFEADLVITKKVPRKDAAERPPKPVTERRTGGPEHRVSR